MQQTPCPVASNRPFVEFAGADDSATGGRFFLFRIRTGIKHHREKTHLFPSQFADCRKIRFEDQPSAAFPTLLQWTVSVKHLMPGVMDLPGAGNSSSAVRSDQSESLSSFGSAAFQDQTTSAGCHSGAESALVGSLDLRRLIRSLHFNFLSPEQLRNILWFSFLQN